MIAPVRRRLPLLLALLASPALADEAPVMLDSAQFAKADGATVYAQVCQGCHMADGRGAAQVGQYPGFADNPTLVSPQYVALVVANGRRNMPAFGRGEKYAAAMRSIALTDAQIAEVTNYLRSHFGNHYEDHITAADVAALKQAP
ncbi:cytochrome c [Stenotrophomonas sp. MMGLT7]|uniref:c-type cytochrome n=1 Tax=Stenotrophomonas sp. MMGLT7 TaxID=2901227 RepID=UPI001E466C0C|nr:cytochrome c [Stenotrophomonas sp. MMGLT7]MCD7099873.1 cytochrome c [Stenotrophomonas sp. MMGLT7]